MESRRSKWADNSWQLHFLVIFSLFIFFVVAIFYGIEVSQKDLVWYTGKPKLYEIATYRDIHFRNSDFNSCMVVIAGANATLENETLATVKHETSLEIKGTLDQYKKASRIKPKILIFIAMYGDCAEAFYGPNFTAPYQIPAEIDAATGMVNILWNGTKYLES